MSQFKFKCSKCDQEHIGLPDVAFKSPVHFESESPENRRKNFALTSDTCIMKDGEHTHYFIRGVLLVPILATSERFGWGVWISLSQPNFQRYLTLTNDDEIAAEPPYFGWFANGIPEYSPSTLSLKAKATLQPGNQRPLITLEPTQHPLAVEQHHGITIERAIELATSYIHATQRQGILDIPPASLGKVLRPLHSDDDLLGEMLEGKD